MTDFRVLLALAALCALALFYVSIGVKGALAPFCAVCTAAVWFSLAGALGVLRTGGWVFYILCAAAAVWLVFRRALQKKRLPFLGFGFWFFVGASLAVIALLWVKKPMFLYWDEFALWGTAGKLMKLNDALFTTTPVGWMANSTQKPAVIALTYFFQFFGKDFVEWQSYAANDMLLLGALATVLAAFPDKKDWNGALPLMLVLALVPFAFRHGIAINYITNVYMDTTADMQMGASFGAVLVLWFAGGGEDGVSPLSAGAPGAPASAAGRFTASARALWPVLLGIAALVLMKDAALILALAAALIILADALFVPRPGAPKWTARLPRALIAFGACALTVAAVFIAWELYASSLSGISRISDSGGSSGAGMLQLPALFLRDLLAPEKTLLFSTVTRLMVEYFFSRSTMFGSGFVVMLIILAVLAAAAWLAGKGALRRRCIVFGAAAVLGFAAYFLFMMCSYLYIFAEVEAMMLASYDRYFYPVYMAFFFVALLFFCQSALAAGARRGAAAKAALVALGLLLLLRTNMWVPVNYTLLGVQPEDYNERREFAAHVESLKERLDPAGKTFLVMTEGTGDRFFQYVHELLPYGADYSYGGGEELRQKVRVEGGPPEILEVTADELARHLAETGCTAVYIDSANDHFKEMYGSLFSDGMAAYDARETDLYSVVAVGDTVRLVPELPAA